MEWPTARPCAWFDVPPMPSQERPRNGIVSTSGEQNQHHDARRIPRPSLLRRCISSLLLSASKVEQSPWVQRVKNPPRVSIHSSDRASIYIMDQRRSPYITEARYGKMTSQPHEDTVEPTTFYPQGTLIPLPTQQIKPTRRPSISGLCRSSLRKISSRFEPKEISQEVKIGVPTSSQPTRPPRPRRPPENLCPDPRMNYKPSEPERLASSKTSHSSVDSFLPYTHGATTHSGQTKTSNVTGHEDYTTFEVESLRCTSKQHVKGNNAYLGSETSIRSSNISRDSATFDESKPRPSKEPGPVHSLQQVPEEEEMELYTASNQSTRENQDKLDDNDRRAFEVGRKRIRGMADALKERYRKDWNERIRVESEAEFKPSPAWKEVPFSYPALDVAKGHRSKTTHSRFRRAGRASINSSVYSDDNGSLGVSDLAGGQTDLPPMKYDPTLQHRGSVDEKSKSKSREPTSSTRRNLQTGTPESSSALDSKIDTKANRLTLHPAPLKIKKARRRNDIDVPSLSTPRPEDATKEISTPRTPQHNPQCTKKLRADQAPTNLTLTSHRPDLMSRISSYTDMSIPYEDNDQVKADLAFDLELKVRAQKVKNAMNSRSISPISPATQYTDLEARFQNHVSPRQQLETQDSSSDFKGFSLKIAGDTSSPLRPGTSRSVDTIDAVVQMYRDSSAPEVPSIPVLHLRTDSSDSKKPPRPNVSPLTYRRRVERLGQIFKSDQGALSPGPDDTVEPNDEGEDENEMSTIRIDDGSFMTRLHPRSGPKPKTKAITVSAPPVNATIERLRGPGRQDRGSSIKPPKMVQRHEFRNQRHHGDSSADGDDSPGQTTRSDLGRDGRTGSGVKESVNAGRDEWI